MTGCLECSGYCPTYLIQQRSLDMDFIRRMQAKDWTIALVAFVAGAFIF
jgi:hypothetical protein